MRRYVILVIAILVAVLCACVWFGILSKPRMSTVGGRIFRYRDARNRVVYTDSIEKVPEAQKNAALGASDVPKISRADYDASMSSVESSSVKKLFTDPFMRSAPGRPSRRRRDQSSQKAAKDSSPNQIKDAMDLAVKARDSLVTSADMLGGDR